MLDALKQALLAWLSTIPFRFGTAEFLTLTVLMLAVVDGERGDRGIDLAERLVSAGCAVQNMLLVATAQGYGSALTSGKALRSPGLRALFQLADAEQALCFISIGTVQSRKSVRARPAVHSYVSTLDAQRGVVPGL